MANTKGITSVKAGEVIAVKQNDGRAGQVEVKLACDNKTNGHWYCVTHREYFENQLMKDFHVGKGKHILAWICHEHGAEQP